MRGRVTPEIATAFATFWRQVEIRKYVDHDGHALIHDKALKDLKALIDNAEHAAAAERGAAS